MKESGNKPPTYRYVVHMLDLTKPATYTRTVTASYFVEESSLLLFKNSNHHVVAAIKSDYVVLIEREDSEHVSS